MRDANITISTKMFTMTDALRNFIQTTCYIRRIREIQTIFKSLRNDNVSLMHARGNIKIS